MNALWLLLITIPMIPTLAGAATIIDPFFNTSNAAPVENICNVFSRSSVSKACVPGNPLYFLIDHMPGDAFPVKNDSAYIITDLHLVILDQGKWKISFNADSTIKSVTLDPNCVNGPGQRCIDQPDAKWGPGASNIFNTITPSNNARTVDFTDPKNRNGVMGINKNETFIDGKTVPADAVLPILVSSSFSAPAVTITIRPENGNEINLKGVLSDLNYDVFFTSDPTLANEAANTADVLRIPAFPNGNAEMRAEGEGGYVRSATWAGAVDVISKIVIMEDGVVSDQVWRWIDKNGNEAWSFASDVCDSPCVTLDPSAPPVPEPATWFLLATGLPGLLGYGWRRRK